MTVEKFAFLRCEIKFNLNLLQESQSAFFRVLLKEFTEGLECFFQLIAWFLRWASHVMYPVEFEGYGIIVGKVLK